MTQSYVVYCQASALFGDDGKLSQAAFMSTESPPSPRLGPERFKVQEEKGIIVKYFTHVILTMKNSFIDRKI